VGGFRKYVRDYGRNWRDHPGSLSTKLALAARNRTLATVSLKGCCGHLGEPGC
jgi:hypothetical protein